MVDGEIMLEVIGINKEELLNLVPDKINRLLTEEEIVYIAKTLNSYWEYDYEAAKQGRVGKHAELKSLRHSDGFFVSRILLEPQNIRTIMAYQLMLKFNQLGISRPDWVAGIPDGATLLGQDVAKLMCANNAEMKKEDSRISMISTMAPNETLILVEDFCTRGTGLKEAVTDIVSKQPKINILPYELVIINRGGLSEISVENIGIFKIVAVATHRVNDWDSSECPLCKTGSIPIKPKATDENWRDITTSQLTTE